MYKIAVLGTGYVGLTTGIGLAHFGSKVLCLDIEEEKIAGLKKGIMPIYEPGMQALLQENINLGSLDFSTDVEEGIKWADMVFIAVGTPQGADGRADLAALFYAAETIGRSIDGYKVIVTKSTVPVGTNEEIKKQISSVNAGRYDFDVVSNPEFLREGKAMYDFLHPDRVVIGIDNPRPIEALQQIYSPLQETGVPFVFTDLRTAELIKYSSNCFLAMKVAFINEMARLCDAVGADVRVLADAVGKDERIGSRFLNPGPGYGGSCFPKDTEALAAFARDSGMPLKLIEATIDSNLRQKLYMVEKIKKRIGNLSGVKLGVLGLAFKAETDDMRDSSSIIIINKLLDEGAVVKVYDPQAVENARQIWGDRVEYGAGEDDTINGADGLVILTEWKQFTNLNLEKVAALMKRKMFFDFRNLYLRSDVEKFGFLYEGVGQ